MELGPDLTRYLEQDLIGSILKQNISLPTSCGSRNDHNKNPLEITLEKFKATDYAKSNFNFNTSVGSINSLNIKANCAVYSTDSGVSDFKDCCCTAKAVCRVSYEMNDLYTFYLTGDLNDDGNPIGDFHEYSKTIADLWFHMIATVPGLVSGEFREDFNIYKKSSFIYAFEKGIECGGK